MALQFKRVVCDRYDLSNLSDKVQLHLKTVNTRTYWQYSAQCSPPRAAGSPIWVGHRPPPIGHAMAGSKCRLPTQRTVWKPRGRPNASQNTVGLRTYPYSTHTLSRLSHAHLLTGAVACIQPLSVLLSYVLYCGDTVPWCTEISPMGQVLNFKTR